MYDGHIKTVENLVVGDQLMGDDSTPRTILSTSQGFGLLYQVTSSKGDPYTVNQHHLLSLVHDGQVVDISVQQYLTQLDSSSYTDYRVGVEFPNQPVICDPYVYGVFLGDCPIPSDYLVNSRINRLLLLAGLIDTNGYWDNVKREYEIIPANNEVVNQIVFLVRSLGMVALIDRTGVHRKIRITGPNLHEIPCQIDYKCASRENGTASRSTITIQPESEGQYYGFTLDGNGRFLLGDFTVTHNSGELQRQVKRMALAGKKWLIIKHANDTRYGKPNDCCTHDLKTMPAIATRDLCDVLENCRAVDVVGIDEGQFFPDIVEFVDQLVDQLGKIVIVAALDGTYEGKAFGRIHELLHRSEQFVKLSAVCRDCGEDASFTIRRTDFVDKKNIVEVVGAEELYESVCRECRDKRKYVI
jgi:thymidine kinase